MRSRRPGGGGRMPSLSAAARVLFYGRGEAATVPAVQRWLSALPDDLVRARPRLLLAQTALAADDGSVEEAASLVDAAERRSAGAADEPFEPSPHDRSPAKE